MVFRSVGRSSPRVNSNARGSARIGTRPSRCAKTSSWMTLVLFTTNTFSMAIVGTSAMRIRRNAFAIAGLIPRISNSTFSASSLRHLDAERLAEGLHRERVVHPHRRVRAGEGVLVDVLVLVAPHVTNAFCFWIVAAISSKGSFFADAADPFGGPAGGFLAAARFGGMLRESIRTDRATPARSARGGASHVRRARAMEGLRAGWGIAPSARGGRATDLASPRTRRERGQVLMSSRRAAPRPPRRGGRNFFGSASTFCTTYESTCEDVLVRLTHIRDKNPGKKGHKIATFDEDGRKRGRLTYNAARAPRATRARGRRVLLRNLRER